MADPCPRCGEQRRGADHCPACGYAPSHPGVLGSLGSGLGTVARDPVVLSAFAVPALLVVAIEILFEAVELTDTGPGLGVAAVATLYPPLLVYLWTAGSLTSRIAGRGAAPKHASIAAGAALAALVIVAPVVLIVALAPLGTAGSFGALASVGVLVLALATLVLAGRALGLPIEAALAPTDAGSMLRRGMRRGRENGGLGLVFLAVVVFATSVFVLAAPGLAGIEVRRELLLLFSGVRSWLLGAWFGASIVHAMAQGEAGPTTFPCPRCGERATAQGGRARCSCGLEGPLFAA